MIILILLILILAICCIILNVYLAKLFASVAVEKGHSSQSGRVFALCFFFGVVGYVYVASLPDVALREQVKTQQKKILSVIAMAQSSTPTPPKKHMYSYYCPFCNKPLLEGRSVCSDCGQLIDWKAEEGQEKVKSVPHC